MTDEPQTGPRDAEELWMTAYHEAGHAVVASLLGHMPSHLEVQGDERLAGSCHTLRFPPLRGIDGDGEAVPDEIAELVLIALAGTVAERIASGRGGWDESNADVDRAVRLAFRLAEDCEGVVRCLEGARDEVERLLEGSWPAVVALARVLARRRVLGREEIAEALQDVLPRQPYASVLSGVV
ncbi:MAG: hypothetical protein LJE95_12150 [Acidobacteria bacterium]|nr:hypothetical protein [Acidobacteriota bacterium]